MATSLENLLKNLENAVPEISKISEDCELLAAQEAEIKLQLRTFATGTDGVKDVSGNKLSNYSEQYAKKRAAAGLQIANKDLVFNKNTSVISGNLRVGTSQGRAAYGFIKEEGARIARYQEEREGVVIFSHNQAEIDAIKLKVRDFAMAKIQEIVNSIK